MPQLVAAPGQLLGERRGADRVRAQPVVEVLTEALVRKVAIRGRDDLAAEAAGEAEIGMRTGGCLSSTVIYFLSVRTCAISASISAVESCLPYAGIFPFPPEMILVSSMSVCF